MSDKDFLRIAVTKGNEVPKPNNFGAVIVKDGKVIAADFNHVKELNDPTAHAETSAIKDACKKLGVYNLKGCTMYGSHEPCLMCFSCAAWAGIERIVYAEPADDSIGFSYEFKGVSLQDMAKKLTRPMSVELMRLENGK